MNPKGIYNLPAQTDIYLIDQIMKGRYQGHQRILDAGCGSGRNLQWFLNEGFDVYGIDENAVHINELQRRYKQVPQHLFVTGRVEAMPFDDNFFDHVISSAVLHFASSTAQFIAMCAEMCRVLRAGGSLFVRMTANIGIENLVQPVGNGVFDLPDGSRRFLLTRQLYQELLSRFKLQPLEPFKTVNVSDLRCMSTLVLQKNV